MNNSAVARAERQAETETTRHCSFTIATGGVILHSAKHRNTLFLRGKAQPGRGDHNWTVANFLTKADQCDGPVELDHLIEGYF